MTQLTRAPISYRGQFKIKAMRIRSVLQHLKGLPSVQRGVSDGLTKTASTAAHFSNQSRTLFSSAQASDQRSAVQFHTEQRTLGYSKEQMFEVVSRVEDYHKFVPWCKKSKVIVRTNDHLTASLVIGFPPIFGEAYNSHVVLFKPNIVTGIVTHLISFVYFFLLPKCARPLSNN